VVDRDGEVQHAEELQLQLVHLRVAHAAHAREEGVAVVAAMRAERETTAQISSEKVWRLMVMDASQIQYAHCNITSFSELLC